MNIFILQLGPSDDVFSIREKMNWGNMRRILIVWPKHATLKISRLELVLIKRHSRKLGTELALVTGDPIIGNRAHNLGIQFFSSVQKAKTGRWLPLEPNQKDHTQISDHRVIAPTGIVQGKSQFRNRSDTSKLITKNTSSSPIAIISFAFLGLAAIFFFAILLFPSAEIVVQPKSKIQELDKTISVNPEITTISQTGEIPASRISVIVESSETLLASGSINIPYLPAEGEARFTNLTDKVIEIPEGTIVHTAEPDVIRFSVTQTGEIQAGSGNSISLPVKSLILGTQANQPTNSIVSIEGKLGT